MWDLWSNSKADSEMITFQILIIHSLKDWRSRRKTCTSSEQGEKRKETESQEGVLTFYEGQELFVFDPVALHVDLESEQQGEQEFVLFIQAPSCVLVHLKGHVLNDVGNPLACNWTLWGPVLKAKDIRVGCDDNELIWKLTYCALAWTDTILWHQYQVN